MYIYLHFSSVPENISLKQMTIVKSDLYNFFLLVIVVQGSWRYTRKQWLCILFPKYLGRKQKYQGEDRREVKNQ